MAAGACAEKVKADSRSECALAPRRRSPYSPPLSMPNPTQDSPAARPRKRRWRILRRVVLGLLLLLAGLYLTRNQVLGPLAVSVAQSQFDEQFDCDLTVEEVSGNWFGNLQLSGVNLVRRSGDFPLARCQDATVALHYSLRSLLSGELAGLHSVELEAARLDIAPPASAEEQPAAVDRAPFELPVVLPAVAISVQRLNVEGEGAALIAWRDVAVQVDPAGPGEQTLELSFVSERERANLTGTYGASGLTLDGELERDELRALGCAPGDLAVTRAGDRIALPVAVAAVGVAGALQQ